MTTIQDLCLGYQCHAAQAFGAEPGPCDCPCHWMTESERNSFLALALAEPRTAAGHPAHTPGDSQ